MWMPIYLHTVLAQLHSARSDLADALGDLPCSGLAQLGALPKDRVSGPGLLSGSWM
jgi:hypothetical protein